MRFFVGLLGTTLSLFCFAATAFLISAFPPGQGKTHEIVMGYTVIIGGILTGSYIAIDCYRTVKRMPR